MLGHVSRRQRCAAICSVSVVVAALIVAVIGSTDAAATGSAGGLFVSAQGNILDTTNGTGGYSTPMTANTWRSIQVDGVANIPASAVSAVLVNFTVINPTVSGLIHADSDTASPPETFLAYVNFTAGSSQSNSAVIPVGSDGKIQVDSNRSIDLSIAVEGYYTTSSTSAGGYLPVPAATIASTSAGTGGLSNVPLSTGSNAVIPLLGVGPIPSSASGALLDVAIASTTGGASIAVYPAGTTRPATSMDAPSGQNYDWTTPVDLTSATGLAIYVNSGGPISLTVSVEGYFTATTATSGAGLLTPTAVRVFDSRDSGNYSIAQGSSETAQVAGVARIPTPDQGISSVAANVHVIAASGSSGQLSIGPDDNGSSLAVVNFLGGQSTSVFAILPLGLDGGVQVFNSSSGPIDVMIDVQGWITDASDSCVGTSGTLAISNLATSDTDRGSAGSPEFSAVLTNTRNGPIGGAIYILDSVGHPVGGSPTAIGVVQSGTRLTYRVPQGVLNSGAAYTWWVTAWSGSPCAPTTSTSVQSLTEGMPTTPTPPSTVTLDVSGSALDALTAPTAAAGCGTSCAPTSNAISLGSDGAAKWQSGLAPDLSGLPAGSVVDSASLGLTSPTCLAATSCTSDTIDIEEAAAPVMAAGSGGALAAIPSNSTDSFSINAGTNTFDITNIVQSWVSGDLDNDGLVLSLADEATSTSGFSIDPPTASSTPADLRIVYTPPAPPSVPTQLAVVAGDDGILASWAAPETTGYDDATGDTPGISSYDVLVQQSPGGAVVASQTTSDLKLVIGGLTDGASYTVSVSATNPVGTGPAAVTSAVEPIAVSDSTSFIQAATQYSNSRNEVESGAEPTTAAAMAADSLSSAIQGWAATSANTDQGIASSLAASSQQITDDSTSLSNVLVVPAAGTLQVTVYATETESFTTVDTSGATPMSIPGFEQNELAFIFNGYGPSSVLRATEDEDSLVEPLEDTPAVTAYSAVLDGVVPAVAPLATDPASGAFTSITPDAGPGPGNGFSPSATAVVNYAHLKTGSITGTNGFNDDCTDFVSRVLHYGGKMYEVYPPGWPNDSSGQVNDNANYWYFDPNDGERFYDLTWSIAIYLFIWEQHEGVQFHNTVASTAVGSIIWVDWTSSSTSGISHVGIVTKKSAKNLYITQHSNSRYDEPLEKEGTQSWRGSNPNLHYWTAMPYEN